MGRILNLGSLNLDYVYGVPHFLQPGETLAARSRELFCGGKGLNQSVAAARAGARVFHAGAAGAEDGAGLLALLRDAGVDVSRVLPRQSPSGHTIIQVTPQGQNAILLWPGANRSLTPEELPGLLAGFGPGDLLVLQNETSCVEEAMRLGAERGMEVCLNPSPMDDAAAALPLELCGVLLINETEGAALYGGASPEELLARLAARFPETDVVLTLGGDGAMVSQGKTGRVLRVPAYRVPVVDTTGAGDTFTGYFLAARAAGEPLETCLRLASGAAALAVGRPGAAASVPVLAEVEAFLREVEA